MNPNRNPTPQAMPRLTFGLVPVTDDARIRLHLGDFCALLGGLVGGVIVPHRAPSPLALASAMQAGRVQIAWLSPTLMMTSSELASVIPLASSVREGVTAYHGALFVAEGSPIRSIHQIAGTRAAWVAPTSAGGYLFPRASLRRRGLDPRTLFSSETFYDTHGRVAEAVFHGKADVGATFAVYEGGDPTRRLATAGFLNAVPGRTGRVLDVAGPIPADIIAGVPGVPIWVRSALTVALQRVGESPAAREALKALFGVERFAPFSASSLRALRTLVELGRGLTPPPPPP
jgi:phosphonate transport system substrate-binding protein